MKPPRRNKRLAIIGFWGFVLVSGVALLLSALDENTQFFYNPSDILAEDFIAQSKAVRIGGIVVEESVSKGEGLEILFQLRDFPDGPVSDELDITSGTGKGGSINIIYKGLLPDLFREGQGIIVVGHLTGKNQLIATDVLAKHDENYRPDI